MEDIFDYITQEDIFNKYWHPVKLDVKYINWLRNGDIKPGCFYKYHNNTLYFVDWAGTKTHYNCFDVVMDLYSTDFKGAINQIKEDFNLTFKVYSFRPNDAVPRRIERKTKIIKNEESNSSSIIVYPQNFNPIDLKFWNQFGITLDTLNKYKVYSAYKVEINGYLYHVYNNLDPMYAYAEHNTVKIYRPRANKSKKWRTNMKGGILEGYTQLQEQGDALIITKSRKDVMCLYELGFNAVAVRSETCLVSENAMNLLKNRFKTIYTLFDNDETGIEASMLMSETYQTKPIFTEKEKDISDFIRKYSKKEANIMINNKINES